MASVAGCAHVVDGDVCELVGRALTIHVPSAEEPRFYAAGRLLAASAVRPVSGGRTFTVEVPRGASSLAVLSVDGARLHRVRVRDAPSRPWLDEARARRREGDLEGARALATARREAVDPTDRAFAIGLLARLALAAGRVEDAIVGLRASLSLHEGLGRTSDRAEDSFALAFALNQRSRRYEEARRVLDALEPALAPYAEGVASLPFYRAEVALETGDVRGALTDLRTSLDRSRRLGLVRLERHVRSLLAVAMHMQGRFSEGLAELRALSAELEGAADASACERLEVALNLALSLDDARHSGVPLPNDAPLLARLSALDAVCKQPHLRGLTEFVFAEAALRDGRLDDALVHLGRARGASREPRVNDVLLFVDLEARIALAQGAPSRARALFAQQAAVARGSDQHRFLWYAEVGTGAAHLAEGDPEAALAAYLRAEDVLDRGVVALPLAEGRGAFLARNESSARAAVELLIARGRPREAFAVVRRARARLLAAAARGTALAGMTPEARAHFEARLATLRAARAALDDEARDDWRLALDTLSIVRSARVETLALHRARLDAVLSTLPPAVVPASRGPAPGEVWLTVFPRKDAGHWVFAATAAAVEVRPVATLPVDAGGWSSTLLQPFVREIEDATRLVVLAYGPLRSVDVHGLPFGAGVLLDRVEVEWALDVATPPSAETGAPLVVGDPTGDLPSARAEASAVHGLLGKGALLLGAEATSVRVLGALPATSLLHFAGHGVFAGVDGLESRLPLSGGQQIGPVEILALPRVPGHVVVAACESGRTSPDHPGDALGVAQAFVVAGARHVVAATRTVPDAATAAFSRRYHTAVAQGAAPPAAFRAALQPHDGDWTAFRLHTP